jgi:ABC-2 type transport system permease protein
MTGSLPLTTLLRYEVRRVGRSGPIWIIVIGVAIAAVVGARNGAALHARQRADAAAAVAAEQAWYADIEDRVRRFSQPSTTPLPYWQDPTDAAAFSRYFLRRHALKPHLPLSALAVGHSDLQPYVVPLRLETLFGGDPVYDYEHPRALSIGMFDLGFVLVWILPIGAIAIAALAGAVERDHGIIPFIASQPLTASRWFAVRGLAILTMVVPSWGAATLLALAVSGTPIVDHVAEAAAAVAVIAAFTSFWFAVTLAVVARGAGAVGALATGAAVWLVLAVAMPLAATAAIRIAAPPPSYERYVEDLRSVKDAVEAERDRIVARAVASDTGQRLDVMDSTRFDYSTRLTMLTPEIERRLQPHQTAREHQAAISRRVARVLEWLSPQMAFQSAIEALAGTSTRRHDRFAAAVREFQLELRRFMYARVMRQAVAPVQPSCGGCPARLNFTDHNAIPVFAFDEPPARRRAWQAMISAAWLATITAAVAAFALRRARWAIDGPA